MQSNHVHGVILNKMNLVCFEVLILYQRVKMCILIVINITTGNDVSLLSHSLDSHLP